jgi:hypothetical protein
MAKELEDLVTDAIKEQTEALAHSSLFGRRQRSVPGGRASALAALGALGGFAYLNQARLKNVLALLAATRRYNAAKAHGLSVHFSRVPPGWIPLTLQADLGPALSEIIGGPVEGAAFSRFGGFRGRRPYSEFLNPGSPYYQVWVGAYVVFDQPHWSHFGFDDNGEIVLEDVVNVLEADQRLVYHGAGCEQAFPNGRRTRPDFDTFITRSVTQQGETWTVVSGQADTWSTFHHGVPAQARWWNPWLYGLVPANVHPDYPEWSPIRYLGQFWIRYVPAWNATCAKFYLYPEVKDPSSVILRWGEVLLEDMQVMLEGIEFEK